MLCSTVLDLLGCWELNQDNGILKPLRLNFLKENKVHIGVFQIDSLKILTEPCPLCMEINNHYGVLFYLPFLIHLMLLVCHSCQGLSGGVWFDIFAP